MDQYANTPYRQRMQQAPAAETPVPIGLVRSRSRGGAALPIDTHSPVRRSRRRRRRSDATSSTPAINIIGFDGISDNGQEIYNFCHHLGIKNIVLMGVHTNMCVLGRPFGIRQQYDWA